MQWDTGFGLKKMRRATELARHGTQLKPDSEGTWLILARLHIRLGEFEEASGSLREAIAVLPQSAELHMVLVEVLLLQDLFEEALPHAEKALAIDGSDIRAKRLYFHVLAALKRWDTPGIDIDFVNASSSSSPRLMAMRTRTLSDDDVLKLCESNLMADRANTNAKFVKAVMLARLGRAEQARNLISLERLIETQNLTPPPGYPDIQAFNDKLTQEIRANPTLAPDPRGKATRDGLHTRFLRQPDAGAIESLLSRIAQAVDGYELRLAASGDEFAVGRPRKVRLVSWAVIYGATGQQAAHRHPSGWLSGVYYVAAPRLAGDNHFRGPLIMGALDPDKHGVEPPWGTREIEPVPGKLVLFPSYVPHATEPSGIDGARICVAFDVVPVQQEGAAPNHLLRPPSVPGRPRVRAT